VKIRFQADADLNQFIVVGVQRREPDIDFRTAKDAGLRGLPDSEVLEIAAQDNRILVSQDFKTMPMAFAQFLDSHGSPGVFIVPQTWNFWQLSSIL
jgi:predicted nuclease of predicted toxin-antitoxin system